MAAKRPENWLERQLVAAALAEEGLFDEAARIADGGRGRPDALDAWLAANGVRMHCAVLSPAALGVRS